MLKEVVSLASLLSRFVRLMLTSLGEIDVARFLRRRMKYQVSPAARDRTARPPIAAPAMAPVGTGSGLGVAKVEFEELLMFE